MTGSTNGMQTALWNRWRIARWTAAIALLLTPLGMMRISGEWHWTGGDFLLAGILIGGVGLLYEWAGKASPSRSHRAGIAVALAASFLTIWTTLVRDDGTGMNFFLLILAAATGGFAAWFGPAGMARAMVGVAIMQTLLAIAIATAPSTEHVRDGAIKALIFGGFFAALWLVSANFFRVAAKGARASIAPNRR